MADPPSAQDRTRHAIMSALKGRLADLCRVQAPRLAPEQFKEQAGFVKQLQARLTSQNNMATLLSSEIQTSVGRLEMDGDCLDNLRAVALNAPLKYKSNEDNFLQAGELALNELHADPHSCFQILTQRYRRPHSILQSTEGEIVEWMLYQLMVVCRSNVKALVEKNSSIDHILLLLNLVGVKAQFSGDLRLLDALNYYYELTVLGDLRDKVPGWLFASFLGIYAQALAMALNGFLKT